MGADRELLRFELIKATEVGDDALAHRAGVGAEGLDNLQIAPATERLIRAYMLRR